MGVYRPRRNGIVSEIYRCEFIYQGKRVQESTGCKTKTAAKAWEEERKRDLERAHAGLPIEPKARRIRTVSEIIRPYLRDYALANRPSSLKFAETKLGHIERLMGTVLLSDLTEGRIRQHIADRLSENASGRTINMELGELSRAIGHTWRELWPKVKKLEERKDVGRALSPEEQGRVLEAASSLRSPVVRTVIPTLLLTGMRPSEPLALSWSQLDLFERIITVGRAKTSGGTGRVIPINDELFGILMSHRKWFIDTFGEPKPDHYVFPFGSPQPTKPDRHATDISSGWDLIRKAAGVRCRLHDLRHTFATQLAENGVPESTMLALMGWMSRRMLEHYSHVRMKAKREAVAGVTLARMRDSGQISKGVPAKVPTGRTSTTLQ